MNTITTMQKVTAFVEGVRSGAIPNPKRCGLCDLYDNYTEHDCIICCHPPVEDVSTQPGWCPIREGNS